MSKFSLLLSAALLVTGGFVIARTIAEQPSNASNQDKDKVEKKTSDAAAQFDTLKKKTEHIFSEWCKSQSFLDEPKIRIARMTSPEQAKITFSANLQLLNIEPLERLFSFYMIYYDGAWTVLKYERSGNNGEDYGMMALVFSLDEALGK